MQQSRRKLLKEALILIGTSAIPYVGFYVVSKSRLNSNPFNLQLLKGSVEPVVLSNDDHKLISSFEDGNNVQEVHDLIKSDYELGRTVFFNSFLFSITEMKISKFRRDKQCEDG